MTIDIPPNNIGPNLVSVIDAVPAFWQFLRTLRRSDFILEMLVNDLDAGATETTVDFQQDRIVISGNGNVIDEDGWHRLTSVQGAGYEVTEKRGGIGIKNHGLKTAFLFGNQIEIYSGDRYTTQYININEDGQRPMPGAFGAPQLITESLVPGCRVEIPLRTETFSVVSGERLTLRPLSNEELAEVYVEALRLLPNRLIGVVRPDLRNVYRIEFRHWKLGTTHVEYRCGRVKTTRRRATYIRTATTTSRGMKELTAKERVWQFTVPKSNFEDREVAQFFRRKRSIVLEIAWALDKAGRPVASKGDLRYPIGYPKATTGLGVSFSAPWASDAQRHSLSSGDETWASGLLEACYQELAYAIRTHLVPLHAHRGLGFLPAPSGVDGTALTRLVNLLLQFGGLPSKTRLSSSITKGPTSTATRPEPSNSADPLLIPTYSWDAAFSPKALVALIPPGRRYLDEQISSAVRERLSSEDLFGWGEKYWTFDERDVVDRLIRNDEAYPWTSEEEADKFQALDWHARASLNVIDETIKFGGDKSDTFDSATFLPAMFLPGSDGNVYSSERLVRDVTGPYGIDGMELPVPIADSVADHALLRKRDWRLPKYDLDRFLLEFEDGTHVEIRGRKQVWDWIRLNFYRIRRRDRRRFAEINVWPSLDGQFVPMHRLCYPRSKATRRQLSTTLSIPTNEVLEIPDVRIGGRTKLSVRSNPTASELQAWLDERAAEFDLGPLSKRDVAAFKQFENDIEALAKDNSIGSVTREARLISPALAMSGHLRFSHELVEDIGANSRLCLLPSDIAAPRHPVISRMSPFSSTPSTDAVVNALTQDTANSEALVPRLTVLKGNLETDSSSTVVPESLRFLEIDGDLFSPTECAIPDRFNDYWGDSLVEYPVEHLSAEAQDLLRWSGIASGSSPDIDHSRRFIAWLEQQNHDVARRHLPQVLRHIRFHHGERAGYNKFDEQAWIPVFISSTVRYESLATVTHQGRHFYFDDFHELAKVIVDSGNPRIGIIPVEESGVTYRFDSIWRRHGLRSLRQAAGIPRRFRISGQGVVPDEVPGLLNAVQSAWFADGLEPFLRDQGIRDLSWRHRYWKKRISEIRQVEIVETICAVYCFGPHEFELDVGYGFDPDSGTLYISSSRGHAADGFTAGVVERISRRPTEGYISSLMKDYLSRGPSRSAALSSLLSGLPETDADSEFGDAGDDGDGTRSGTGEGFPGHNRSDRQPTGRIPTPGPIAPGAEQANKSRRSERERSTKRGDRQRNTPKFERDQRAQLVTETYAAHCQVCLASQSPHILAPDGSYIFDFAERKRLMEAHHVDHYSAGGDFGAHNLLILCKFHHDELGDSMSRSAVLKALNADSKPHRIEFHLDEEASVVDGVICSISLPTRESAVSCFFESHHAERWLEFQ